MPAALVSSFALSAFILSCPPLRLVIVRPRLRLRPAPPALPRPAHAALPPVDDVLAELLQFSDEVLWPALRELPPDNCMGSAFADRLGLTLLRFQLPLLVMLLDLDPNADPGNLRRSGYVDPGPMEGLGNQDDWNPAWLRQLWTRPTWRRRQWIDVEPPLPRPMAKHGPWTWSNPAGWHIRVCNYIFRRLRPLSVGPLFGPLPTSFVSARRIIRPGWNAKGPATAGFASSRPGLLHTHVLPVDGFHCVGMCLRPIMYGEHKAHSDHVCINCLKGH